MSNAPQPPYASSKTLWPAFLVLLIAVGTLLIFTIINVVFDRGVQTTTTTVAPIVVGTITPNPLTSPALTICAAGSVVPNNIQSAFIWPIDTHETDGRIVNAGAGDFDCSVSFVSHGINQDQLLTFFRSQLASRGWNYFSSGASNGDPQYLFQKAGSDTFYWVVGVTVTAHASNTISWTFRAYQNSSAI